MPSNQINQRSTSRWATSLWLCLYLLLVFGRNLDAHASAHAQDTDHEHAFRCLLDGFVDYNEEPHDSAGRAGTLALHIAGVGILSLSLPVGSLKVREPRLAFVLTFASPRSPTILPRRMPQSARAPPSAA